MSTQCVQSLRMRDSILRRLQHSWSLQVEIIQSKNKCKTAHVLLATMPRDADCKDDCRDAIIAATSLCKRPEQLKRHKTIKSLFDSEILPFVQDRPVQYQIRFCRTQKEFVEWENHVLAGRSAH